MPPLMYHDVVAVGFEDSSGFPGHNAALYKVTPEQFVTHLDAIVARRLRSGVTRPASLAQPEMAQRLIPANLITVDDGGVSALVAADALEQRGFRGAFFITSNYVGAPGFLNRADLRTLQRRGHLVGSHSCSHPLRMGHLPWTRLVEEWAASRCALSDILGDEICVASVPGGDFAPAVADAAAEAGFTQLFTSEPTSAIERRQSLTITGRFTIQRWMSAATAAALACGVPFVCARQAAFWKLKKTMKYLAGEHYLRLRSALFCDHDQIPWGDTRSNRRSAEPPGASNNTHT